MKFARLLSTLSALTILVGCAPSYDDAVAAYEAGDYTGARDMLNLVVSATGDRASPDVFHHLALASLHLGELEAAEAAAAEVEQRGNAHEGLADFVRGHVAWLRSDAAAEQARQVQAEPFAFELAIRHADDARDAWGRASVVLASRYADRSDAARRNAERAWHRAEALRKERDEAAKQRQTKKAGGGKPRFNVVQQPPKATDADGETGDSGDPPPDDGPNADGSGEAGLALADGELPADQVLGVLETLRSKEDEKLATRRARRGARSADVEQDW